MAPLDLYTIEVAGRNNIIYTGYVLAPGNHSRLRNGEKLQDMETT